MSTNKNASIRYQTLDKCFRDFHHRYYLSDLLEKCEEALYQYNGVGGVSRRQLFEDIKFMESEAGWQIPLLRLRDGKKTYYRYADKDFSINRQPLTDDEVRQLQAVIQNLRRFHGIANNEWIDEVLSQLEWRFGLHPDEKHYVCFDQNQRLRGLRHLPLLIDATYNHQVLEISYQSYKEQSECKTYLVHPYHVKQYNNRWFLLGKKEGMDCLSNFALDRIHSAEPTEQIPYVPAVETDFEHYFDEVIGVTLPDESVEMLHIRLRFTPHQFAYAVSKPLHPSQQTEDAERHILSIDVRPNYELDYHILSFGPGVEVLSPASYRQHIREKITEMCRRYASDPTDARQT